MYSRRAQKDRTGIQHIRRTSAVLALHAAAALAAWLVVVTMALTAPEARAACDAAASFASSESSLPPTQQRQLEDYLKQHGLTDVLVTSLEEQLADALGEDRVPIAERLSLLYSKLMDEATDETQRDDIEQRSLALLKMVPNADTEQLRLNIQKASYLRAERTAELWRLRAADDAARTDALRIMSDAADSLSHAFDEFRSRTAKLANMDVGKDPLKAQQVSKELSHLDVLTMEAAYYGAWAHYYQAFLSHSTGGLDTALALFSYVLQSDRSFVSLQELSDAQFSYEEAARAAIGIALCLARQGNGSAAMDWIKRLEDDQQLNDSVRKLLPGYTFVVMADGGDWAGLSALADRLHNEGTLTPLQNRLVAVLTLENAAGNVDAQQLAEHAIAWMSEAGDLTQVIEVADAFDFGNLQSDSFVVSYVLAIKANQAVRSAHHSEQPTTDPQLCAQYAATADMIQKLIERPDASHWPDAVSHALLMQAWCSYYASQFDTAATRFASISNKLSGEEAENALWMSIVCVDRLAQMDTAVKSPTADQQKIAQAHRREIRGLMHDFVSRFPSSRRAGKVRYRLATTDAASGNSADDLMARVDNLLAIPRDSDVYAASQIEAERLLYQIFLDAPMVERPTVGQKYLAVALPLLEADQRRALIGPANPPSSAAHASPGSAEDTSRTPDDAKERYLIRARRILDVQLTRGIARLADARTILDRLERAGTAGLIDLSDITTELAFRRFQISMLSGQSDQAIAQCEAIWKTTVGASAKSGTTAPESGTGAKYNVFAMAACREIYQYAVQDWQSFPTDPNVAHTLKRVIDYGRRSLLPYGEPPKSKDPAVLIVMVNVVEASEQLGQADNWKDEDNRKLFETWAAALYSQQPNNFRIIRAQANHKELDGEIDQAVDLWRTALSGLDERNKDWFEAKFNFIRLLARVNPAQARVDMAQHRLLHPDYGPEPWGAQLRQLDQSLGSGSTQTQPAQPVGQGGQNGR